MKEFAVAKVGKSFGTHGELTINLYAVSAVLWAPSPTSIPPTELPNS